MCPIYWVFQSHLSSPVCYLQVLPPCVSLPRLPPQPAHYGDTGLASLPSSYLSCLEMESWSHGKFWSSADDRQPPHLLAVNLVYFSSAFLSSHFFSSPPLVLDLPEPPPPKPPLLSSLFFPHSTPFCLIPVRTSFCLPLQTPTFPHTINVKIRPGASNPPAECVILTTVLQSPLFLRWYVVTYRLYSHHNNEKKKKIL